MDRIWKGRHLFTLLMVAFLLFSVVPAQSVKAEEATEPSTEESPVCTCNQDPCVCGQEDAEGDTDTGAAKYTVTFVNEDGTVLQSAEVDAGVIPVYTGETPVKEAGAQYTYTFSGWSPEIVAVTEDTTYTAAYSTTVNTYTVTWVVGETVVETDEEVPHGTIPEYNGETPTKERTAQYTYTFDKWVADGNVAEEGSITGNVIFTASFASVVNQYTIAFVDEDCTVLQSSSVEYGKVPEYTEVYPSKDADEEYTYIFAGWSPEVAIVTGDATYTATYKKDTTILTLSVEGCEDGDQVFVLDLYDGQDWLMSVPVHGDEAVVLYGLTIGREYTLSLQGDWAWRYVAYEQTVEIGSDAESNIVAFEVIRVSNQWLDGNDYAVVSTAIPVQPAVSGEEKKEGEEVDGTQDE